MQLKVSPAFGKNLKSRLNYVSSVKLQLNM